MTEDIFNFLKTKLLAAGYTKVYDTILPYDDDSSPTDNVCTVRFAQGQRHRDLKGVLQYVEQPISVICRGTDNRKTSRTRAEAAVSAIDGVYGQSEGSTDIIYMSVSPAIDEGISEERGQAYHTLQITAKYGPSNA